MSTSQTILQGIPTFSASKSPAPIPESKPGNNTFNQILKNEVGNKIKKGAVEQPKTSPIQQRELKDNTSTAKNAAKPVKKDTSQEATKNTTIVTHSHASNNTNSNATSNADVNSTGMESSTRKQSNQLEAKEDTQQEEKSEHEQLTNDDLNDPSSLLAFVGNINALAFSTAQNKSSEQVDIESDIALGKVNPSEINPDIRLDSQVAGEQALDLPMNSAPPQADTATLQMRSPASPPTTPTTSTASDVSSSLDSKIKLDPSLSTLMGNTPTAIPNQGSQTKPQNTTIENNDSSQAISAAITIDTDTKIEFNVNQKNIALNESMTNKAAPPRLSLDESQLVAKAKTNAQGANDVSSASGASGTLGAPAAQTTQTTPSAAIDIQNSQLASSVESAQTQIDKSNISIQGLSVASAPIPDSASKSNTLVQNTSIESRNVAPIIRDEQTEAIKSTSLASSSVQVTKNVNSKSTTEQVRDDIGDRNKLAAATQSTNATEQIKSPPANVIIENQASTLARPTSNTNANLSANTSTNDNPDMSAANRVEQTVDKSIANENVKLTAADPQNSLTTVSTKSFQGELEGAKTRNTTGSETFATDNKSAAFNTVSTPASAPSPIDITKASTLDHISPRVGTKGWDQAIGQKIVWMVAGGEQSAQLTLNPPDLGPVQVVLSISDHFVDASFVSSHLDVREAIEAAAPKLREMMDSAGISLSGFSVSADSTQSGNAYSEAKAQSNTRNVTQSELARSSENDTVAIPPSNRNQGRELGLVDTFV